MWLPSKAQVDTGGRYALAIASTAIGIFGLQAKGISLDQVKAAISALGDVVNNMVILATAIGAIYATVKGVTQSSPTNQVASAAATGAKVITTPEIAAAIPSANVTSSTETKVVNK
jgi:hypothetical protein